MLATVGMLSFFFVNDSYAKWSDDTASNEISAAGQVSDSISGSSNAVSDEAPVSEPVVAEIPKEASKSTASDKSAPAPAISKQAEIDHKANDIKAQEQSVAVLEKRLEGEKAQLKEMQDQFCKNFPSDCGKIGSSGNSGSSWSKHK